MDNWDDAEGYYSKWLAFIIMVLFFEDYDHDSDYTPEWSQILSFIFISAARVYSFVWLNSPVAAHKVFVPSPSIDSIMRLMTVWRITGKIIITGISLKYAQLWGCTYDRHLESSWTFIVTQKRYALYVVTFQHSFLRLRIMKDIEQFCRRLCQYVGKWPGAKFLKLS